MRALVIADIHLDMWPSGEGRPGEGHPLDALTREEWDSLDLVVVAGDLINRGQERWRSALAWLSGYVGAARIHVFPGNHDFYGHEIDREGRLADQAEAAGAHWAQKAEIILPGRRFLCCTLWTDMALGGDPVMNGWLAERQLNDYRLIRVAAENFRRLRAADTVALHRNHRHWLEARLGAPFDGDTVVVTHHAPHPACLGRFESGALASAFASDLTGLIEAHRPAFWVYGHTHVPSDFTLGVTHILNVSIGYPPGVDGSPPGNPRVGLLKW